MSSLALSEDSKYCAVASQKPKIHIFKTEETKAAGSYYNPMSYVSTYYNTEGSFANFMQNDKEAGLNSTVVAFTDKMLHVISKAGKYHKILVNDKGGGL